MALNKSPLLVENGKPRYFWIRSRHEPDNYWALPPAIYDRLTMGREEMLMNWRRRIYADQLEAMKDYQEVLGQGNGKE